MSQDKCICEHSKIKHRKYKTVYHECRVKECECYEFDDTKHYDSMREEIKKSLNEMISIRGKAVEQYNNELIEKKTDEIISIIRGY